MAKVKVVRNDASTKQQTFIGRMGMTKQKKLNLFIGGSALLFILLIGVVIYFNVRSEQPAGNEEVLPSLGNSHIEDGGISSIAYNSTPPTSGPHYGGLAALNIYPEPVRYEQLLHNLEDGGVVVYYQCGDGCPELVSQLEGVVSTYLGAGRKVILVPNDPTWTVNNSLPLHQDMGSRIALTAWQSIDKFDEFDESRMRKFIDRYEGIDHH